MKRASIYILIEGSRIKNGVEDAKVKVVIGVLAVG